ncbi:hypothetical protein RRG08_048348 [Elysia crispata]|uniref:Uncharacterized protein n=1 Tax=Elysia crispata TaxID=231223 RepID=A0AAE0YGZ6_9GAST|nr:hypothetical protein RRG08_048348 [Elysia crispata]
MEIAITKIITPPKLEPPPAPTIMDRISCIHGLCGRSRNVWSADSNKGSLTSSWPGDRVPMRVRMKP